MEDGIVLVVIVCAIVAFILYKYFTEVLMFATAAGLIALFYWVYKQYTYMVNEPAVKKRFDEGRYESALQDLADIPSSSGSSADEAVAQHLNELCRKIQYENQQLSQRMDYLKATIAQRIQSTGNLEDRLKVAKSGGIDYEKSLLQQLAKTYGLKIES